MNQDPIADREAKIAAWREKVRVNKEVRGAAYTWDSDSDNAWTLSSAAVQEAVALMRSAPDGDAKLRELRAEIDRLRAENERLRGRDAEPFDWDAKQTVVEWVEENLPEREPRAGSKMVELHADEVVADRGEARRVAGWLKDIMSENARLQTEAKMHVHACRLIDDRRAAVLAENDRLQADLAAAVKAHQFAEASQKVEQGLAKSAEARVAHLERDLAAARADQAAMARRELESVQQWAKTTERHNRGHYGVQPTWWLTLDAELQDRLAALPAQQPKPDAATAYEGDPKDCAFRGPIWPAWKTVDSAPHHKAVLAAEPGCGMAVAKLWDDGTWRGDMGDHFRPTHWVELPDWPSEFPQSRGEPKPDAATRDGDEVLREWLDPDTEGRPISGWVAVMARVLDEVCRRELARGGK